MVWIRAWGRPRSRIAFERRRRRFTHSNYVYRSYHFAYRRHRNIGCTPVYVRMGYCEQPCSGLKPIDTLFTLLYVIFLSIVASRTIGNRASVPACIAMMYDHFSVQSDSVTEKCALVYAVCADNTFWKTRAYTSLCRARIFADHSRDRVKRTFFFVGFFHLGKRRIDIYTRFLLSKRKKKRYS